MKKIFVFSILATVLFTVDSAHAWIEPTTVPPGNNIFAPINSSAFGQSKVGGLILNLGNAAHGLIVKYGLVGIGTDNPQAKLDVVGKIRSTGLEVNSTTEGALLPRMTTTERDAIASKVEGLLIYNTTTKQLEIYSDGAWKSSGGSGDSIPKGTISFFNLSTCPSGWTEKTELRGRYVVAKPDGGTLLGSQGTALTNLENRAVGQHNHGVTDPGHSHNLMGQDGMFGPGTYGHFIWNNGPWSSGRISNSTTSISIQNSGSVVGTNAPYVQLLACEKLTTGSSGSGGTATSSFWQNNGTSIYYNDGNIGVGTSTPSTKMEIVQNNSLKLGNAYLSSGGDYVHLANNEWYNGSSWIANAAGALIQIAGQAINFYRHDASGNHTWSGGFDSAGNLSTAGNINAGGNLCVKGDCKAAWPEVVSVWNQYSCSPYWNLHYIFGSYDYYLNGKIFSRDCNCMMKMYAGQWSYWYRPYVGGYLWENRGAVLGLTTGASNCAYACYEANYSAYCIASY